MIPTLILAAGKSSRMGDRDKLLEPVDGVPILQVLCARALSVGPTYVTLPALDHQRAAVVPDGVQIVIVDQTKGMAHSVKTGINALPDGARGVMILPADMPDITSADLTALKHASRVTSAPTLQCTTDDGLRGHPIYFASSEFAKFADLSGDRGAFRLLDDDTTQYLALGGDRARLDLDTPEDWAAYRAR